MMSAALIITVWPSQDPHVLQKGPQFKEQISRKVRCFGGEYARVDKVEIETGRERRAEEQVFCAGK